jgi:aminoglycoside phosphotransferase family enzyme/predicted kinase
MGGTAAPIEYAVKMVQFPAEDRLDRVLAAGGFGPDDCDRLANLIADCHLLADAAPRGTTFGEAATIARQVQDVLNSAVEQTRGLPEQPLVEQVRGWVHRELARLNAIFAQRKSAGWIRQCHGDLHCENIVVYQGQPVPFDCLEFRDDLRWIDCASDIAFLSMDLADRGHAALAHRLLNKYLVQTGDIEGLGVLRYYQVYRALVRAIVTTMQASSQASAIPQRAGAYLQLAEQYTRPRKASLVITHGVSGTGKTTATQELLEQLGAVRLRSDNERRSSAGKTTSVKPDSPADRYSPAARDAVYEALLRKTEIGLAAGYPLIVDATFLRRKHRDEFRQLAARHGVPFVILAFDADLDTLRRRITERQHVGKDASEATFAVLDQQLAEREPLADNERDCVVAIRDGDVRPVIKQLQNQLPPVES